MPKASDITGQRFGRLTALRWTGRSGPTGKRRWNCRCDCGALTEVDLGHLTDNRTQSCGCLKREKSQQRARTHGKSKTALYKRWKKINERCYNPKSISYKYYGARGIIVCDRWHSFENFYTDMGDPPPNTSIDRINNDGPYAAWNCRWATNKEQRANRRLTPNVMGNNPHSTAPTNAPHAAASIDPPRKRRRPNHL